LKKEMKNIRKEIASVFFDILQILDFMKDFSNYYDIFRKRLLS